MNVRTLLSAALLLGVAPMAPVGSAADDVLFAGTTVIESEGNRYARFRLPTDSELKVPAIQTESERAILLVLGSGGALLRLKAGDDWAGNPVNDPVSLTAGTYFVYLLSDGPMSTTLRFAGLSGTIEVTPATTTRGSFERLDHGGLVGAAAAGLPIPVAQRFTGTQPFEAISITGFMNVREFEVRAENFEYRWSNEAGVTDCFSSNQVSGAGASWTAVLHTGDQGPRVTLDHFRTGATLTKRTDVYGYWIERAPDHPAPPKSQAYEPLLWELDGVAPDAQCARHAPIVRETLPL